MKNILDTKRLLSVYQKIEKCGTREEGGMYYEGMHASTDHDGYRVYLSDGKVTVQLGFHHAYAVDAPSRLDLDNFQARLRYIDTH
ncbi:MAG: hypothetical protein CMF25_04230 [Kangiellaceae bacterium]|jgi:hypothetical protein|nr:hypothetical protein [Kangiellaceae bacterium]|tara:strand:- start:10414 stop:10668 length:255 start_codon:yes stop_codon:yes gene_type:complete